MYEKINYRSVTNAEIQTLSKIFDNILVELPTGYGKTLISINRIAEHLTPNGRFLFFVPKTDLIENAKKDFIKHGFEHLISRGDFACYASSHNFVGSNYDVVVLDEIHNAQSDLRTDSISKINRKKLIGLSATIDEDTWLSLSQICNWHRYIKTLQQAFAEGVLKEPKIIYKEIELDNKIKRNTYKFTSSKTVVLTDREYYDTLTSSITYWRERYQDSGEVFAGNKMKSLGKVRQTFLADCKEDSVKQLIGELGNNRFICFCGSVAQAKRLGPKTACSSHTSKKGNQELIDKFNNKEIGRLFAKDMLKEGTNLVDTDYGILIQAGNKEKDFIQMLGRTLRSDNPIFYIFKAKDTVDTRFINNSTKQLKYEI